MTGKGLIPKEELTLIKDSVKGPKYKLSSPNGKDEVVFTSISRPLYREILDYVAKATGDGAPEADTVDYVNERILDSCVLWPRITPEEKLALPVGVIPDLVHHIQVRSGFVFTTIDGRVIGDSPVISQIQEGTNWGDTSPDEADSLKEKNKHLDLFRARLGRKVFIIKPFSRSDLRQAAESADPTLALIKLITVWPENLNWDDIAAGTVESLGQGANRLTGYVGEAEIEEL